MSAPRRTGVALTALLALAAALPAGAAALDVGADDGAVRYVAGPNEVNVTSMTVDERDGERRLVIRDYSDIAQSGAQPAPLNVQAPCRLVSTARPSSGPSSPLPIAHASHGIPDEIECPVRPALDVTLSDLDDAFAAVAPLGFAVRADGGAGNDVLASGEGADALAGGPGRDLQLGGLGPDVIDGGEGEDTVRYGEPERTAGVTVTLAGAGDDGSAEDGPAGARDTLTGVEGADGSRFADRITGDDGANDLDGDFGADTVDGGGGDDTLAGGGGRDRIEGGAGEDAISSRDDERDRIACDAGKRGRGRDELVAADAEDRLADDCETVAVADPQAAEPPLAVAGRGTGRGRSVRVRLRCLARERCTGRVVIERPGGGTLGRGRFGIPAGGKRTVRVRLRRPAPRRAVVLTATSRDFTQRTTRTTRRVRLR
ncbi:MAG TPA: hypothetical protein VF533_19610 [Solirubrobacteraceae bacterium]